MDYLVYVEHNAENLRFLLWYRDYVRCFDALPEKKKVLSPERIPEVTEAPDLSKGTENESKKKARREAVATMMETGYDSRGTAPFSEEQHTFVGPGRHMPVDTRNESVAAASTVEPKALRNTELATQSGLKWQPCRATYPSLRWHETH